MNTIKTLEELDTKLNTHFAEDKAAFEASLKVQQQNIAAIEDIRERLYSLDASSKDLLDTWLTVTAAVKLLSSIGKLLTWLASFAIVGSAATWLADKLGV